MSKSKDPGSVLKVVAARGHLGEDLGHNNCVTQNLAPMVIIAAMLANLVWIERAHDNVLSAAWRNGNKDLRQQIGVAVMTGLVVGLCVFAAERRSDLGIAERQEKFENQRFQQQERLENVRFARQLSVTR